MAIKKQLPTASAEFLERVCNLEKLKASAKECYKAAADLEEALIAELEKSKPAKRLLSDGRVVGLKDNFAKVNTVWKNTPVRRFEVEVLG